MEMSRKWKDRKSVVVSWQLLTTYGLRLTAGILLTTYHLPLTVFIGCAAIQKRIPPPHAEGGEVVFQYISASAKNVCIAGEFNGWEYNPDQQRAIRMKKNKEGIWEARAKIASGRYQYKYVIDYQTWIIDPYNPYTIDDGTGNINSLLIVK